MCFHVDCDPVPSCRCCSIGAHCLWNTAHRFCTPNMWPSRQNHRPPMFRPPTALAKGKGRPSPTSTSVRVPSSVSSGTESGPRDGKGGKGVNFHGGQRCCTCPSYTHRHCGNTECKNPCCVVCIQTVPWATLGMCHYCAQAAPQPNDDALAPPPHRSRSPWHRARRQRDESQRYGEIRAQASSHLYLGHRHARVTHP